MSSGDGTADRPISVHSSDSDEESDATSNSNTSTSRRNSPGSRGQEERARIAAAPGNCPWRNRRFFDQECALYFDCPSHQVERLESGDEDDGDVAPGQYMAIPGPAGEMGVDGGSEESTEIDDSSVLEGDETSTGAAAAGFSTRTPARRPGLAVTSSGFVTTYDTASSGRVSSNVSPIRFGDPDILDLTESPELRMLNAREMLTTIETSRELPPAPPPPPPPPHTPLGQTQSFTYSTTSTSTPTPTPTPMMRPTPQRQPSEIVLPRWQPDAEATICSICKTAFGFVRRKHHCRKCGRVVCAACSPHRIMIPTQYIVQNPNVPPALSSNSSQGERVRLCNPCVPDPQVAPAPPQTLAASPPQRSNLRSPSNISSALSGEFSTRRYGAYFPPANDPLARSRGFSLSAMTPAQLAVGSAYASQQALMSSQSAANSSGNNNNTLDRRLPQPSSIAEEDECPVCHNPLPARTLPDFERLREAHISACIESRTTRRRGGGGGAAAAAAASASRLSRSEGDAIATSSSAQGQGQGAVGGESSTTHTALPRSMYLPYKATEKDCVDAAECSICFEEFEVGVPMARLTCLCRFHRHCIDMWYQHHFGCCPMHHYDVPR